MLWKMQCFTFESMGRTNHTFPVYATPNVQTHLKINYTIRSSGEGSSGRERPGEGSSGRERPGEGSSGRERPGGGSSGRERPGGGSSGRERPGNEGTATTTCWPSHKHMMTSHHIK